VVVDTQVREVIKEVPYIRDRIKEVEVIKEKIVPLHTTVQEIVTAQQIIEKIVEKTVTVPKILEVERLQEKMVPVTQIQEVEKIIPHLINVNKYIQKVVERIVEVPIIMERVKEVVKENEKVVEVRNEYETVREVEKIVEKAVVLEKFKEAVRDIHHIEKVLQIVDRIVNIPVEIIAHEERLVEVPYLLEKIVEKIVIMPQIVEVLKYVHEVSETETLGVAIDVDAATYEQRYMLLVKDIRVQLDGLLVELRRLRSTNPALKVQIEAIEAFLAQLEKFILAPRLVEVPKIVEKVVEKDRIVRVPGDERSVRMELSLSLLVEKLITELKRIKRENPRLNLALEEDVRLIFFPELDGTNISLEGELAGKLKAFSDSVNKRFESLGSWSLDHQLMLNSFLQERFMMANLIKSANSEIEVSKKLQQDNDAKLRQFQGDINAYRESLNKLKTNLSGLSPEVDSIVVNIFREIDTYRSGVVESTFFVGDLKISDARIQSLIREKDADLARLREEILALNKLKSTINNNEAHARTIQIMQEENAKLKTEINSLRVERGSNELIASYKQQIQALNDRIHEL